MRLLGSAEENAFLEAGDEGQGVDLHTTVSAGEWGEAAHKAVEKYVSVIVYTWQSGVVRQVLRGCEGAQVEKVPESLGAEGGLG